MYWAVAVRSASGCAADTTGLRVSASPPAEQDLLLDWQKMLMHQNENSWAVAVRDASDCAADATNLYVLASSLQHRIFRWSCRKD